MILVAFGIPKWNYVTSNVLLTFYNKLHLRDGSVKELSPTLSHPSSSGPAGLLGALRLYDIDIHAMCADGGMKFLTLTTYSIAIKLRGCFFARLIKLLTNC